MVSAAEIQHTRLKGELVFQDFCLKLIRRYWQDDYAEAHGRSGQRQHGADITGRDNRNGYRSAAVQCKASETDDPRQLSESELIHEVEQAKGYKPKLDVLIVAYAGDRNATLQRKAQELSADNEANGLFRVVLWSWDDIVTRALDFADVAQELLVHNQVPTAAVLDPKRPRSETLQSVGAALQTAMATLQAASIADEAANTGDPVLDGKLDVFRDQLRGGNGQMLIEALRQFVADLPADASQHVRFRAFSNLASALAQVGDLDAAIIAYDAAADAEPDTGGGHTSRSRAALLRGDRAGAFAEVRLAMAMEPDRFTATVFLEAAPLTDDPGTLELQVAAFVSEVEVAASLSRLFAEKGLHREAIRVSRGIKKDDWRKDGTLGQALLGEFGDDIALRIGAPMSPGQEAQIDEARVRLERAWKAGKLRADWKNWTFYAANLASTYRLLGRDDDADRLVLDVFSLDPAAPSMAQRAALAFTRGGNLDGAWTAAKAVLENSNEPEDLLLAATIAVSRRDWLESSKLADKVLNGVASEDEKAHAAEIMLQSTYRKESAEAALSLASTLRSKIQSSIGFESRVAEIARGQGDTAELEAARKRLEAFGPIAKLGPIDRFELADAYSDDGEWSKAADLLEGLHALDRPSEILQRRLFALYRADRRADARALYQALLPGALASQQVLRLGAAIYERSGLLNEALAALGKAIARDHNDLRARLDWVRLNIRNGTEGLVRRWAKTAPTSDQGDPQDLLEFAQILDRYGHRRRAIDIGYGVLQAHWGESERLHMLYMSLFLLHSRTEAFLRPKVVGLDAVVFLENEHGGRTDYKIEAEGKTGPNVLPPAHPFALQLTGKKVGDEVVADTGIGQATTWTVVEIKHKSIDLLHRSMNAHATLFPGSRSLGQFYFDPTKADRFEPMFEQARERARTVSETISLYNTQPLPIDSVALMLGTDAIDAARGLRFISDTIFDSCIGAHEERELALQAVQGSPHAFLVDVLTLALWDEIGFLPELVRLQLRPKVVQATIDALVQRADEASRNVAIEGGSLEARGEQVIFIEISKQERQAAADASQTLLDWVRANTELVPTEGQSHELLDEAEELLSASSYDTVTTGAATGTLLLIEDRRLRGIAAPAGGNRSSWSQPLLMLMRHDGRLTHGRYVELIAKLARHKIGFVSIGVDELATAAALGHDTPDYRSFCEAVTREGVDLRSMVAVAAEFMTALWSPAVAGPERLCSPLFERMLTRHDAFKLFSSTVVLVQRNLKSLGFPDSLLAKLWASYVDRFAVGHFIREALANWGKLPSASSHRNKKKGNPR